MKSTTIRWFGDSFYLSCAKRIVSQYVSVVFALSQRISALKSYYLGKKVFKNIYDMDSHKRLIQDKLG